MDYNSDDIEFISEFEVGDTVKCHDSNDAIHTICEMLRKNAHTQILNREPDGTMTIKVTRTGGKFD